jgi:hypothetical protein
MLGATELELTILDGGHVFHFLRHSIAAIVP